MNKILLTLTFLLLLGCGENASPCPDSNCADYTTQQEAQAAYQADPECKNDLDADNDGIACEDLPVGNVSTGCPTTSNCGCSNKNKSDCGGPCCQWIVGTGCKCK